MRAHLSRLGQQCGGCARQLGKIDSYSSSLDDIHRTCLQSVSPLTSLALSLPVSIHVHRAHYGAHGHMADVTPAVQWAIAAHGGGNSGLPVSFRVDNASMRCGDPAPGVVKHLTVVYSWVEGQVRRRSGAGPRWGAAGRRAATW